MKNTSKYLLFVLLSSLGFERALFILFLREKGLSFSQISALQIALFVANLLSEIPTGIIGDRCGKKLNLSIGGALAATALLAQWWFGDFLFLLIAFIFHGISFSFISGSGSALFYESLKRSGQERHYYNWSLKSRYLAILGLGLAMSLGGVLQQHSWFLIYILAASAQFLSILFILLIKEERVSSWNSEKERRGLFSHLRESLQLGASHWRLILPPAIMYSCLTPYFVYAQKIFKDLGLNELLTGLSIGVTEWVSAAFIFALASWSEKYQSTRKFPLLILMTMSALITLNYFKISWLSIAVFAVVSSLAQIISTIYETEIQDRISDDSLRASILSVSTLVSSVFIAIGYISFGFLLDHFSASRIFAGAGLITLIAALASTLQAKEPRDA